MILLYSVGQDLEIFRLTLGGRKIRFPTAYLVSHFYYLGCYHHTGCPKKICPLSILVWCPKMMISSSNKSGTETPGMWSEICFFLFLKFF